MGKRTEVLPINVLCIVFVSPWLNVAAVCPRVSAGETRKDAMTQNYLAFFSEVWSSYSSYMFSLFLPWFGPRSVFRQPGFSCCVFSRQEGVDIFLYSLSVFVFVRYYQISAPFSL